MMQRRIIIAAALIRDGDGRLLLVRKRGTFAFMQAGGKIEPGETPLEALVRELEEELAYRPTRTEAEFLGVFSAEAANEPGHLLEAHLFRIEGEAAEFTPRAELDEAIWIWPDAAEELHLAPFTREHVLPIARLMPPRGNANLDP